MAKRQANFRLSDEALSELRNMAAREGTSQAQIIEDLLLSHTPVSTLGERRPASTGPCTPGLPGGPSPTVDAASDQELGDDPEVLARARQLHSQGLPTTTARRVALEEAKKLLRDRKAA